MNITAKKKKNPNSLNQPTNQQTKPMAREKAGCLHPSVTCKGQTM